ncbi:MAG: hypothetical protein QOI53_4510 [Verrucomicrobiota bacterium]|nr:hypothetical protein [Verrucomicrobiota bacterium]
MLRRFRYLCQAGRLSPDWRIPFSATFRGSGLAPAIAPSRSFCPSELPDHNLLTALPTTQFRANVAALDDVATAVLVRSFNEMAFPLVPSRSSRERVKSLRREVLRKFGSNKHARFMLRMRLSLDCGCVTVATQGGPDNRFAVITRTVVSFPLNLAASLNFRIIIPARRRSPYGDLTVR